VGDTPWASIRPHAESSTAPTNRVPMINIVFFFMVNLLDTFVYIITLYVQKMFPLCDEKEFYRKN
jgi:hypothetical protein